MINILSTKQLNLYEEGIQLLKIQNKNYDEIRKLKNILKTFNFFRSLETDEDYQDYLTQLSTQMKYQYFDANEIIFNIGDKCEYIYFVFTGIANSYIPKAQVDYDSEKELIIKMQDAETKKNQCQISGEKLYWEEIRSNFFQDLQLFRNNSITELPKFSKFFQSVNGFTFCVSKKNNTISQGGCFGEISLLQNNSRTQTVISMEPLQCGVISVEQFYNIFANKQSKLIFTLSMLGNIFPGVQRETLISLTYKFQRKKILSNEIIFRQGEDINGLYIIFEGEVGLWQEGEKNKMRICSLGKGEFIGLEDFQKNKLRSYTANALPPGCVLYFLQKKNLKYLDDKKIKNTIDKLFQQRERRRLSRIKVINQCEKEMMSNDIKDKLKEVKTKDILGEFIEKQKSFVDQILSKQTGMLDWHKLTYPDQQSTFDNNEQNKKKKFFLKSMREYNKILIQIESKDLMSNERINKIANYNQMLLQNRGSLENIVYLCQGFKPFEEEREKVQIRLSKNFNRKLVNQKSQVRDKSVQSIKSNIRNNRFSLEFDNTLITVSPYKSARSQQQSLENTNQKQQTTQADLYTFQLDDISVSKISKESSKANIVNIHTNRARKIKQKFKTSL